jgi:hypothetical protein
MSSEALHSFVDSGNEILLLYGQSRATRAPDVGHPLGYGRELYFWSFVVALLIFALGSGVSILQGVLQIRQASVIEHPLVSYLVLALAFVFEGASWLVAFRQFRRLETRGEQGLYESFAAVKILPPSWCCLSTRAVAVQTGTPPLYPARIAGSHFGPPWGSLWLRVRHGCNRGGRGFSATRTYLTLHRTGIAGTAQIDRTRPEQPAGVVLNPRAYPRVYISHAMLRCAACAPRHECI